MHHLDQILIVLGCGCVLPIMVVWFVIRESMNKTNQRTQIVLAAIEKNPDMDIEELTDSRLQSSWINHFSEPTPFFERFFLKRID